MQFGDAYKPYVKSNGTLVLRKKGNNKSMTPGAIAQREKFGKAVQECKGKAGDRAEFSQCMREHL